MELPFSSLNIELHMTVYWPVANLLVLPLLHDGCAVAEVVVAESEKVVVTRVVPLAASTRVLTEEKAVHRS
jgi:hypothetical protein